MMASDAGTVERVSVCRRPARGGDVPQVKDELGNRLAKPDNSLSRPRLAVCPSSQWRAPKAEPAAATSRGHRVRGTPGLDLALLATHVQR